MKTVTRLKQAELIQKLYDIRRETALRTARGYVGGDFQPKSVDAFINLVKDGGKQSGHIMQVGALSLLLCFGLWPCALG